MTEQAVERKQPPWKMALTCLALLVLLGLTVFASNFGFLIAYAAVAMALWFAARGPHWSQFIGLLHMLATIPLFVAFFGWCTSQCGGLHYYESILGVPTIMAGFTMHIVCAGLWLSGRVSPAVALVMSALTVGGSVFFTFVLVYNDHFCASCFGTHCVSAAILLLMLSEGGWQRANIAGGWVLAACGLLGFILHPSALPQRQGDFDMIAYLDNELRAPSAATSTSPSSDGIAPMQAHAEADQAAASPAPAASPALAPFRQERRMGVVGDDNAPIVLIIHIDPECQACSTQMEALRDVNDLLRDGIVHMRFLLQYRSNRGQLAANAMYLATLINDARALTFMREIKKALVANEDILELRQRIDKAFGDGAYDLGRSEFATQLTSMYQRTRQVRRMEGVSSTPYLWLYKRGESQPVQRFNRLASAQAVRTIIGRVIGE